MRRLALIALFLLACSSSRSTALRLGDGSWHLVCKSAIGGCIHKADQVCKGRSYQILRGKNEVKMLGHELGESQVSAQRSEVIVRCAGSPVPQKTTTPLRMSPAVPYRGTHGVKAPPPMTRPPPALTPSPTACTKGATQACVGPGACAGGQVCLDDGSGYGPCDCGPAPSSPATPAP